jgi:hypothetical protein
MLRFGLHAVGAARGVNQQLSALATQGVGDTIAAGVGAGSGSAACARSARKTSQLWIEIHTPNRVNGDQNTSRPIQANGPMRGMNATDLLLADSHFPRRARAGADPTAQRHGVDTVRGLVINPRGAGGVFRHRRPGGPQGTPDLPIACKCEVRSLRLGGRVDGDYRLCRRTGLCEPGNRCAFELCA